MKLLTTLLLVFSFASLNAQKLKTKKENHRYFREVYTINKATKLKEGAFKQIHSRNEVTLCEGNYSQGQRIGVWKFYDQEGVLSFTYNYDAKSVEKLKNTASDGLLIPVMRSGQFIQEQVDREPYFLGYEGELEARLSLQMDVQKLIKRAEKKQGITVLSMLVDARGQLRAIRAEETHDLEVAKMLIAAMKTTKDSWLPAVQDGQPVSSKIFLVHDLRLSKGNVSPQNAPQLKAKPGVHVFRSHFVGVTRTVPVRR